MDELTRTIIGLAIEVHRHLGPGLLESAYQQCLVYEIEKTGLDVQKEIVLPIHYKEIILEKAYKIDLLIENKLVIELKVVEEIADVHVAQILTYMKFGGFDTGLLINFNVKLLKNGIKRFKMSF